jgi:hypothetical protein
MTYAPSSSHHPYHGRLRGQFGAEPLGRRPWPYWCGGIRLHPACGWGAGAGGTFDAATRGVDLARHPGCAFCSTGCPASGTRPASAVTSRTCSGPSALSFLRAIASMAFLMAGSVRWPAGDDGPTGRWRRWRSLLVEGLAATARRLRRAHRAGIALPGHDAARALRPVPRTEQRPDGVRCSDHHHAARSVRPALSTVASGLARGPLREEFPRRTRAM